MAAAEAQAWYDRRRTRVIIFTISHVSGEIHGMRGRSLAGPNARRAADLMYAASSAVWSSMERCAGETNCHIMSWKASMRHGTTRLHLLILSTALV
eukprot:8948052-Heterocapsa_arctica.AAC.1